MSLNTLDRATRGLPRLTVIIGSTRTGRVAAAIGQWFVGRARSYQAFDVEVADLAAVNLPMLDEPKHPRLRQYTHQHTRDWSALIDRADAVVFVTPEYNHGYPAPLKNAIDFLHEEWADKPVGFVSYGGVSAGTRSVQQLKPVVTAVGMIPVIDMVNIPFVTQFLDDNGRLEANDVMNQAAERMLDDLLRFHRLLRTVGAEPVPRFRGR
jgi:NAD(P)H-dependent FMN reductase